MATPIKVLVVTIPPHGHYMTIRDIARELDRRGHVVTFALCEQSTRAFAADSSLLGGTKLLSAGPCPAYEARDAVMRAVIAEPHNLTAIRNMMDGVSQLSREMCDVLVPAMIAMPVGSLPDVILFDADTACGLDLAHAFLIPAVARVGTGLRDSYTTPLYAPLYGSGLTAPVTITERLQNWMLIALSRLVISPVVLPSLIGGNRARVVTAADTVRGSSAATRAIQQATSGLPHVHVSAAASLLTAQRTAATPELPWGGITTLYNTHFGLEYPRPTMPYEFMVGSVTDYAVEAARPVQSHVAAWLNASRETGVPVVVVSVGTLAALPSGFLDGLAVAALREADRPLRWLWALPAAQTHLVSPSIVDPSTAWIKAMIERATASATSATEDVFDSSTMPTPPQFLVVDWFPQVAVLRHEAVIAFITHGAFSTPQYGSIAHAMCT